MTRVGIGYDSHRFTPGRPLILGGQQIPHSSGLAGHSDADAVAHAVTDAILGAAAAGDIGALFPDTDPAWKDADSMDLLARARRVVEGRGWRVVQADVTIITEVPKLAPFLPSLAAALAATLGVAPSEVGVKAKTNEGMGFIGRGEGVAVIAVATLEAR
jgi:2-C-methyl-D-erythritol 2,4-cyclodiphosphate synthase